MIVDLRSFMTIILLYLNRIKNTRLMSLYIEYDYILTYDHSWSLMSELLLKMQLVKMIILVYLF